VQAAIALAWIAAAHLLIPLGYGSDVDAWLVGDRAMQIWASGTYQRSRSTGFPLYELSVTPFVHFGGWSAANAYTAAWGLLLLYLIFRLARRGGVRHPALSSVTFLFLPIVLKSATSTMDYVPALTLLLAAYVALTDRRQLWSAVLIGVACGFRPSSGLYIVPAIVWVLGDGPDVRQALRTAALMFATALTAGAIAFSPSLGLGTDFGIAPVTTLANGVLNGLRMFGIAQSLLLVPVMAFVLWRSRRELLSRAERAFVAFHTVNIVLWIAFFMLLPGEPEYLMPAIPSVILVLDRYASPRAMFTAAAVLLSFHLVSLEVNGSRGGLRPRSLALVEGFTVRDVNDRRFKLWLREATSEYDAHTSVGAGLQGREYVGAGLQAREYVGAGLQAGPTGPVLFMEQILPPTVGHPEWTFDERLEIARRDDGELAVSQRITDVDALAAIRAAGYRIVAWRARAWEYDQPKFRAARPFIEFVDDPGALLGVPLRGRPFDLTE
jgi:hypothetical protein